MTPQEIDTLRKDVRKAMIDLGFDKVGSYDRLRPEIAIETGFPVSKSQLSMSLTGYRASEKNQKILSALKALLERQTASCEHIHDRKQECN